MHDKNGKPLAIGDQVIITATIVDLQSNPEFCNVLVKFDEPMYPSDRRDKQTFNTRQLILLDGKQLVRPRSEHDELAIARNEEKHAKLAAERAPAGDSAPATNDDGA
jgi:hypothetical protein